MLRFRLALLRLLHLLRHRNPGVVIGKARCVEHAVKLFVEVLRRVLASVKQEGKPQAYLIEFVNLLLAIAQQLVHDLVLPLPILGLKPALGQVSRLLQIRITSDFGAQNGSARFEPTWCRSWTRSRISEVTDSWLHRACSNCWSASSAKLSMVRMESSGTALRGLPPPFDMIDADDVEGSYIVWTRGRGGPPLSPLRFPMAESISARRASASLVYGIISK